MTTASLSEVPGTCAVRMATAITELIEHAEIALESDRSAAKDCITRALALLRNVRPSAGCTAPSPSARPQPGGLAPWQVSRLSSYIDTHLESTIRAQDLTQIVKLSVSRFFRAFKISFGMPPLEYVARRRIDLACELMVATDQSICQIALACGLCDQSHFCRVFRRILGVSPSAWRRANCAGPDHRSGPDGGKGTPAASRVRDPVAQS
jgi:AraC family transcriptional regulator